MGLVQYMWDWYSTCGTGTVHVGLVQYMWDWYSTYGIGTIQVGTTGRLKCVEGPIHGLPLNISVRNKVVALRSMTEEASWGKSSSSLVTYS